MDIWVLVVFFIFSGVVCTMLYNRQRLRKSGIAWGFFLLGCIFFAVHVVFSVAPSSLLAKFPGVTVEDSEYVLVEQGGVVVLRSGVSGLLYEEFYILPNTSEADIAEFLSGTQKPTYFYVKAGSSVYYVKNMGKLELNDADMIKEMYDRYISEQLLPRAKVRYWLFKLIRIDI